MTETCKRCGKPAAGSAHIGYDQYCHGDEERPSCYEQQLWDDLKRRSVADWGLSHIPSKDKYYAGRNDD